jgi:hypothetical protein
MIKKSKVDWLGIRGIRHVIVGAQGYVQYGKLASAVNI